MRTASRAPPADIGDDEGGTRPRPARDAQPAVGFERLARAGGDRDAVGAKLKIDTDDGAIAEDETGGPPVRPRHGVGRALVDRAGRKRGKIEVEGPRRARITVRQRNDDQLVVVVAARNEKPVAAGREIDGHRHVANVHCAKNVAGFDLKNCQGAGVRKVLEHVPLDPLQPTIDRSPAGDDISETPVPGDDHRARPAHDRVRNGGRRKTGAGPGVDHDRRVFGAGDRMEPAVGVSRRGHVGVDEGEEARAVPAFDAAAWLRRRSRQNSAHQHQYHYGSSRRRPSGPYAGRIVR
ncbi:MAG: hypothetical protein AAFV51_03980 [Pseudomonadota bacterium]